MVLLNVQLSSEVGIDYTPLKDLLAQGKWKAASRETTRVMVVATRHTSDSPLEGSDLAKLPGLDLQTIDQLWVVSSQGHFGFSVQQQIWKSLGGGTDWDTYSKLGDRFGWRRGSSWIFSHQLVYSLDAPQGHLPFCHRLFFSVMDRLRVVQSDQERQK